MKKTFLFSLLGLTVFCASVWAQAVSVELKPTQTDSSVNGQVQLEEVSGGLQVIASVKGVSPGKHGFHFHENGSCADGGKGAGSHFNPDGSSHGLLHKDGLSKAHAGDMGNIEVGSDGTGKLEIVLPSLTLTEGRYSVMNKAIILHEKEDDFGQPTGNAGGRIACGVVA